MKHVLACALLALLAEWAVAADLYKWQDTEGHVHYADQPPPPGTKAVERVSAKGNVIESDTLPFDTKAVTKKYPVTLYSFKDCAACTSGEALLNKRGIPFTLKNQEVDKVAVQKLTGDLQVPVLVVGNQPPIKGYQESQWDALLDLVGYPKNNPLGKFKKQVTMPVQKPGTAQSKGE